MYCSEVWHFGFFFINRAFFLYVLLLSYLLPLISSPPIDIHTVIELYRLSTAATTTLLFALGRGGLIF